MEVLIKKSKVLYLLFVFFVFASCQTERRIAQSYIEKQDKLNIIVLKPELVYKNNRYVNNIQNFDEFSLAEKDSLWLRHSRFLKYIPDTVFIKYFHNAFADGLRSYGFQVYEEKDLEQFLSLEEKAYMINIAQVQLDEYVEKETVSEMFDDTAVYYKTFDINVIDINMWFEVSTTNDSLGKLQLFYTDIGLADQLEGDFRKHMLSGEVRYKYQINMLHVQDILDMASVLGRRYASWFFDEFMNAYIQRNWPSDYAAPDFLHYNQEKEKLERAYDKRFQYINNNK